MKQFLSTAVEGHHFYISCMHEENVEKFAILQNIRWEALNFSSYRKEFEPEFLI